MTSEYIRYLGQTLKWKRIIITYMYEIIHIKETQTHTQRELITIEKGSDLMALL